MVKQNEKRGKGAFIQGALWIALGGFIAKLIGALYRIPLTNLIGGHGIGLYQMVYPTYCILLTVSATGIPSSIAKLTAERVAEGKSVRPLFSTAMRLFLLIGLFGSISMALLAPIITRAQGSNEIIGGYYTLAPAVFLTSAISVFRGYFQGKNRMLPTALSEITEQVVKVGFGLLFAYLYRGNVQKAVVFLLLAVSVSELCALILMCIIYARGGKDEKSDEKYPAKNVLRLSIPVTFSSMLLPFSGFLDSVLAVRLLRRYASDAVSLFGLFSGGAVTIINLPVSICYGIAVASVPALAGAKEGKGRKLAFSIFLTVLIALPSAIGLYFFASPIVRIVYRNLAPDELCILIKLVKTFAISALTLSLVQTLASCLTAQGKPKYSAISMLAGMTVKTGAYLFLLRNPKISVFGLAHATNVGYLVAFSLDLLYNLIVIKRGNKP